MPSLSKNIKIQLTATAGQVIYMTDNTRDYKIYSSGTVNLVSNWSLTTSGTPLNGMKVEIVYNPTVTLGVGAHVVILGQQIPDTLVSKSLLIKAFYNGSSWEVSLFAGAQQTGGVETDDIQDEAVTNDKLADLTQGSIKIGDASARPVDLTIGTTGQIPISNGTTLAYKSLSGAITVDANGVTTIADDTISIDKLEALSFGEIIVGNVADNKILDASGDGYIIIGNGNDIASFPLSGDATMANDGYVTLRNDGGAPSTNSMYTINDNAEKVWTPRPLEYRAYLTQVSTAAPTEAVVINNIGAVTWSRTGIGVYVGTFANPVVLAKTFVEISTGNISTGYCKAVMTSTTQVTVSVYQDYFVTPGDNRLSSTPLAVTYYPETSIH